MKSSYLQQCWEATRTARTSPEPNASWVWRFKFTVFSSTEKAHWQEQQQKRNKLCTSYKQSPQSLKLWGSSFPARSSTHPNMGKYESFQSAGAEMPVCLSVVSRARWCLFIKAIFKWQRWNLTGAVTAQFAQHALTCSKTLTIEHTCSTVYVLLWQVLKWQSTVFRFRHTEDKFHHWVCQHFLALEQSSYTTRIWRSFDRVCPSVTWVPHGSEFFLLFRAKKRPNLKRGRIVPLFQMTSNTTHGCLHNEMFSCARVTVQSSADQPTSVLTSKAETWNARERTSLLIIHSQFWQVSAVSLTWAAKRVEALRNKHHCQRCKR